MSNSVNGLLDLHVPTDKSVGWRLDGEQGDELLPGAIYDNRLYPFCEGLTLAIAAYEREFVSEMDIPNWRIMVIDGVIFRWDERFASYASEKTSIMHYYNNENALHSYYMKAGPEGMVDKVCLEFFEGDSEPIKDWMVNYSGIKFPNLLAGIAALEGLEPDFVNEGEVLKSSGLLGIMVYLQTGNHRLGTLISSMETLLGVYFRLPRKASILTKRAFARDKRDLKHSNRVDGERLRPVSVDLPIRIRHLENLIFKEMTYKEILSHLRK